MDVRRAILLAALLAGCTEAAVPAGEALEVAPGPGGALALLGPESREALARSPVPMLYLPEHAGITRLMSGEHWAALHARTPELTISLHATDVAHPVIADDELAHLPPADWTVRGEPARLTLNEQIRSVAWTEAGVAYALEVECARPFDDERCTESGFVLELADRLVPAGAR